MNPSSKDPNISHLMVHGERGLLVKILCELRVLNLLLANEVRSVDDVSSLRNEVMAMPDMPTGSDV